MTQGATAAPTISNGNDKIAIRLSDGEVFHAIPKMTDEEFDEFCLANRDLRLEQAPQGNITIMPPSSYDSGRNEMEVGADLAMWNRRTKLGKVFSPSSLFKLPDGSKRMPDAA